MSAKDVYHNTVKAALQKDGWTITHDPLILEFSRGRQLRIDLGAEQIIAAQKDKTRIAVEVKSFLAPSTISEFHTALGQLNELVELGVAKQDIVLGYHAPYARHYTEFAVS